MVRQWPDGSQRWAELNAKGMKDVRHSMKTRKVSGKLEMSREAWVTQNEGAQSLYDV
jgi:hypothetical protein